VTYDEKTAARVKKIVGRWKGISSRGMFRRCLLSLNGTCSAAFTRNTLFSGLGSKVLPKPCDHPLSRPLDITGRPMKGWIMVSPGGFAEDEMLSAWLLEAKQFVATLPEK